MDNHSGITYYEAAHESTQYRYHFHLYYEIMYVISGEVTVYSNGNEVSMQEGTVCIIPPFTPHKTKYSNAYVKNIIFGILYIENYISEDAIKHLGEGFNTNVSISRKNVASETVESLIDEIERYDGESAYIYIYKLLLSCDFIHNISHREDKTITKAITYIGINSKGKLTLDDLAKKCGVSKFHMCREFKKELGITPIEYVTFAKIRRAVTKLYYTDYTIAKISNLLSFYSPKYFTKIFRACFDVSPSRFRKSTTFELKKQYYLSIKQSTESNTKK